RIGPGFAAAGTGLNVTTGLTTWAELKSLASPALGRADVVYNKPPQQVVWYFSFLPCLQQIGNPTQDSSGPTLLNHDLKLDSQQPLNIQSDIPPYRSRLLDLHRSLVEISSTTGHEAEVGTFLSHYLQSRGFDVKQQNLSMVEDAQAHSHKPRRFNILARPSTTHSSTTWNPRLLITSHIDVVPPYIPYSIDADPSDVTEETIIRGRGSADAKGSVASQIIAVEELVHRKLIRPEDVMLLYVVGEEVDGAGMKRFSDFLEDPGKPFHGFESVIFGEPTENKLACGHKGIIACTITASGKAGHSGYPWLGESANEILMRALVRILDTDLGSSDKFGNTTINVGTLAGGIAFNVIPEFAQSNISARVAIGPEDSGHVVVRNKIETILAEENADHLSIECFQTTIVNYGTDIPNLKGNHTRYLYGPGSILVAHSDDEELTVGDLESAVKAYQKIILHDLST
ncbi:uncharacterized protein PpBr36_10607, partial [Pyricularia pennisetigena]|uniref:uncharacterized protein n=1 Tax=Pyricularia pennisetigena TaxID=1578925 RepID=UPI001150D5D0